MKFVGGFCVLALGLSWTFTSAIAAPGRLPPGALKIPLNSPTQESLQYDVTEAYPGLTFTDAVAVAYPPDGTSRLFVLEQRGTVRVFHTDSPVESSEFLDLSSLVRAGGELGLLGLAFDPHYSANGFFYVNYTASSAPLRTVVARFKVSAQNPDRADFASHTVLLEFNQPYSNHNGGALAFGPDGMLYIATGDGGSGGDPQRNGQNLNALLGKILRIDVHQTGSIVPRNNPFAGQEGKRGEIWLYGLRNPWRFSFDRQTGNLWIGDVGQNAYEEVDVVPAGRGGINFGWNICEGNHVYSTPSQTCTTGQLPIHEYDHSVGSSVIGGYVYRGSLLPQLRGKYIYSDFYSRDVWALQYNESFRETGHQRIASVPSGFGVSSFGEDPRGELLLVGMRGAGSKLFKLLARNASSPANFPKKLSETGLFSNTLALQPHRDLLPYDVNVPLWSDSAQKSRWMALPATGDIDFRADRPWGFPEGTVFVKHFEIPLATGAVKRLETRVLMNHHEGWAGYTYRWNEGGTDADLLEDRDELPLTIANPDGHGAPVDTVWKFPGRAQCMQCHTDVAGFALGFNTFQLNRAKQLENLRALALIPTVAQDLPKYPDWRTNEGSPDRLARAYLAVNCSMCHQPGGPTPLNMDVRFTTPIALTQLLSPASTSLGPDLLERVHAGSKEQSVLWERMRRLDHHRMPLLGSSIVDSRGVRVVGDWIDALGH